MKISERLIKMIFIFCMLQIFNSCYTNNKEVQHNKEVVFFDLYTDSLLIPPDTVSMSDIKISTTDSIFLLGKIFSGYIKFISDNNAVSYASIYKGVRQGYFRSFYANGKPHEIRHFKNNKNTGRHYGYWPNGNMQFDCMYVEDKKVGFAKKWFENGTAYLFLNYKEDKEDGLQRGWRPNGKLFANYVVKNGVRYGLQESALCYNIKNKENDK
jgi:antitoxin component YwqK of YwqJK toxin-antitoxin module